MALFSLKKIAALAQNRQAYLRGVALYNAGRVARIDREQNDFYTEFITADIRGDEEETFSVEVGLNSAGEATYLYCSCDRYREGMGACRHIVCALTDKYYTDMLGGLTTASRLPAASPHATGETAKRLMRTYYERNMTALQGAGDSGTVELTPTLVLADARPLLALTVGRKKQYVVKDMARFRDAVQNGETLTYGKDFSFFHSPSAFSPDSRRVLQFVLSELAAFGHTNRTAAVGRELPLTPGGLDRLLSLFAGRHLAVRTAGKSFSAAVTDADPPLTVTAKKVAGGYQFETAPAVPLIGAMRLYVLNGTAVYRCSEAFRSAAADWLLAVFAEREPLFVTTADMPAFCAKVLTRVEQVLAFEGDADWRQYLPEPLETKIYLDSPDDSTVTAAVQFCYGERVVPLFAEVQAGERRDVHKELEVRLLMERYFTGYLPETGEVVFHGDDETIYTFLTEGVPALEETATVFASADFKKLRPVPPPQIAVGVNISGDLLEVELDLEKWSSQELQALLAAFREHRRFTRLKSGAFVRLDDEILQGFAQLSAELALTPAELKSGRVSLPRYRALQLQSLLAARPAVRFRQETVFRELIATLQNAGRQAWPVPPSLENTLRGYQKEGFRWLKTLDAAGFGGILADDMGLGKTLQMICLLLDGADSGTLPSLVVCPTSLVLNWVNEIHRFAPSLSVLAVMGDAAAREELIKTVDRYQVVVTSYDLLKRDILLYRDKRFQYHILDEAQYIKNQKTQNARAVKTVVSERRFALTGTPMENRLSELWSIFDFLMPGFLYSYSYFKNHFELPIVRDGEKQPLERLSAIVAPFLLRRMKRDVLTELPPKTEQVLLSTMEPEQEKLYAACAMQAKQRIGEELAAGTFEKRKLSVLTLLMRLRQICCDPALCTDGFTGESCKRRACMELVREACDNGHRILLFSQFTSMLDILKRELDREKISYLQLTGATPAAERTALADAFNSGSTKVFLISLKAGGTGLNLTGADVVIHYDPWWNSAAEQQATDRAYRIGQENPVQVVRLVVKGTIEEKIMALQHTKQQIADAVLSTGAGALSTLTAEELLALL